ncbi:MAG: hypothetical protein ACI9VR_004484 [Cognaticolwellia sp.]|jgi:hypothetical protein
MLTLLLALSTASAQDCNTKALQAGLAESTPTGVPVAFKAMAQCDAALAAESAPQAFEKVLAGKEGNQVLVAAVKVGANDAAMAYINGLQSDERSRAVASLGSACNGNEQVSSFLTGAAETLGESFWTDRWYRSLAECRNDNVQAFLQSEVDKPERNKTSFFGVVEVYARNLGKDSIPTLKRLLGELQNEEELTYVVNAFADAAQVGGLEGQNAETTQLAVAAIVEIAPELPPKAVEQARTTLLSLGAESEANALGGVRYQDRMVNGKLQYGVVVVETATCKKGNQMVGVHMGILEEGGNAWPDQVTAQVDGASYSWEYNLAAGRKCKGTSQNTVFITNQPVAGEDLQSFFDEQRQDVIRAAKGDIVEISETAALTL